MKAFSKNKYIIGETSMNKVLSIVVPSYNVEDYLNKCLNSFIDESIMDDIEVLIVNDGSTDSTQEIACVFTEQYPNTFRLINKKNGGHGSTINKGIELAQRKYFKVVDGDDWVDTTNFVQLVHLLKTVNADVVASNYTWINHTTMLPEKRQERPFEQVEYGKLYDFSEVVGKTIIGMHAMTIKTELLRKADELIDEHTFYVDAEFILFPIPYVKTIFFTEDPVYQYRLGLPGQSMSIQKMQKNLENHLRVLFRLNDYCIKVKNFTPSKNMDYMMELVAEILTSQIKIYISFPLGNGMRKQLMKLDRYFYHNNREVYDKVKNSAVWLLRRTHYFAYPLAVLAFKHRRNSY